MSSPEPADPLSPFLRAGFRLREFRASVRVPAEPRDVAWNQRDPLHPAFVHGGFRFHTLFAGPRDIAGLALLQVGPFPLPVVSVQRARSATHHQRLSTLGPLVVEIDARTVPLEDGVSRIDSTFRVAFPRGWAWAAELAGRAWLRNHRVLAEEDRPLLARRTELRRCGHRFTSDEPDQAGYDAAGDAGRDRVIPPPGPRATWRVRVEGESPRTWLVGQPGMGGLRVVWDGSELRVSHRSCPHDGADLSRVPERPGGLPCPWHGRLNPPLWRLRWPVETPARKVAGGWDLNYDQGWLAGWDESTALGPSRAG